MNVNDVTVLFFGSLFYLMGLFFMYRIMKASMERRLDALLTVIVERYEERCTNCEYKK